MIEKHVLWRVVKRIAEAMRKFYKEREMLCCSLGKRKAKRPPSPRSLAGWAKKRRERGEEETDWNAELEKERKGEIPISRYFVEEEKRAKVEEEKDNIVLPSSF